MITTPSRIITHAKHLAPKPKDEAAEALLKSALPARAGKIQIDMSPSTWDQLHKRALTVSGDDTTWMAWFTVRVGGNCDCRKHWNEQIKATPPDFTRYFGWTVDVHNAVNARLGKPILTEEEARSIWTAKLEVERVPTQSLGSQIFQ